MIYNEIFKAILADEKFYIGGDIQYTKWSKCPDGIISLEIRLPYGDNLVLHEYEQFNFYVGAMKNLVSKRLIVNHVYALGLRNNDVHSYRVTLVSSGGEKHKVGDITARIFPFGKEGMGRTSTSGWKKGFIR